MGAWISKVGRLREVSEKKVKQTIEAIGGYVLGFEDLIDFPGSHRARPSLFDVRIPPSVTANLPKRFRASRFTEAGEKRIKETLGQHEFF